MINSISANCYPLIQTAWVSTQDLFRQVWNAVSNFFQYLAAKIHSAYTILIIYLKGQYAEAVLEKLVPYQNMSQDPVQFMKKAIELYREFLAQKDQRLTQALKDKIGNVEDIQIPDDQKPNQLQTFDAQLENLEGEAFAQIAIACIRAFIFSNVNERFGFFEKCANWNWTDHFHELQKLQREYKALARKEKEALLEDRLDQCKDSSAKRIYGRMMAIANDLVQGNNPSCHLRT